MREPTLEDLVQAAPTWAWGPDHYELWSKADLVWRILFLQNAGRFAFVQMIAWRRRTTIAFVLGIIAGMFLQHARAS